MSVANRRVTVVVEGSSTSAQEALTKAADAMKKLGDAVAKQSQLAIEYDKQVIRSNDAVIASYDRMLASVTRASQTVDSELAKQNAAQAKTAASAGVAADDVTAAAERQAAAARGAASAFDAAAKAQVSAFDRVQESAKVTADEMVRSAQRQATAVQASVDKQVAAQTRAAQVARDTAVKNNESFNLAGTGLAKLGRNTVITSLGVGAASLYMSAKFEASTTRLLTQAGATHEQMEQMRHGVLNMAGALGQTPEHLTAALYHVVSSMNAVLPATTRTGEELKIMKVAAQGAAVGGTDLEETAYALASAMNALHLHAGDASKTMGTLNAIVGAGDMTMGDLLAALKSGLIPTARTFGISLTSIGTALAVMGDQGIRGALAGTRLRMSISLLAAPSKKAAEMLSAIGLSGGEIKARTEAMSGALEAAGLSTTKMAEDLKKPNGLSVAFKDLDEHLRASGLSSTQAAALLSRAFGGGRMGATIMLLAQSTERLDAKFHQIHHTTNEFGKDWGATQETLTFQVHQTEAALASLAIRIGHDLTPAAKDMLKVVKETAEWFEHNDMAARALGITIGGVLSVAVGAFVTGQLLKLVNTFRRAGDEYSKLQRYFRTGFGGATAAAGSTNTVASTASGSVARAGMIWGVRGVEAPGSIANPIVVAIEGGQYAGLGGRAAAIGIGSATAGEQAAARAEKVTPGGVILPPGVKEEVAVAEKQAIAGATGSEEAAITATLGSSIRNTLGGVMANAMKGGMVGFAGTIAAQMAGTVVGGKTGHSIASIGTDAALGAAVGTAIEPGIGTAVGAAVGGIGPQLMRWLQGHTQGEKAAGAAKGMGQIAEKSLQEGIDKANKAAEESIRHIQQQGANGLEKWSNGLAHTLHQLTGGIIAEPKSEHEHPVGKIERERINEQKQAQLYAVGQRFGKQLATEELSVTKGFGPIEQLVAMITDTEKRLSNKNLPAAARKGAFDSIMAIVKAYQDKGKLPPTSVEEMMHTMEARFPDLKAAFSAVGVDSIQALNQALKGQQALSGIEGLVHQWQNILPSLPSAMGLNMNNAEQIFKQVNDELTRLAHSGPESQRIAATTLYKKLRDEEIKYFSEMRGGIEGEIKHLNAKMVPLTAEGTQAMETSYKRLKEVIEQEMAAGVKSTAAGTQAINKVLKAELLTLGMKPPSHLDQSFGPTPGGHGNALMETGIGGSSGFKGFAGGGMVQFGKTGDKGRDTIPVNFGGVPVMVGSGEVGMVLTKDQQHVANARMADIGGLPGLFTNHKRPNYMAEGGFVAEPGANFSFGKEPQIVSDLRKLAQVMKTTIYGISGYRSPQHSVSVGGFANDPHTRGEAADIGIGSPTLASASQLRDSILRSVGLYRPFYPASAHEINHVQLLGSAGAQALGGGIAGSTAAAAIAQAIKAPHAGGSGVMHVIAQHVLNTIAAAANQKLGVTSLGGGSASLGNLIGKIVTASEFGGHNDPGAFDKSTASGKIANDSLWGFAELSNPPGALNFSALGGLPMGTKIKVGYGGRMITVPKVDVGAGGPGLGGRVRAIDLTYAAARALGAPGLENVAWQRAAEGLMLGHATGGHVHHTATMAQRTAAHHYITKPPTKKPSVHKAASVKLGGKLNDLNGYAGLEHLDKPVVGLERELKAFADLANLLKGMEGNKNGTYILPTDMPYITSTLQPGETINPGWTTAEALRHYEGAELALKGVKGTAAANELELQQQIIHWAEGQASHRLVTPSQASILAAPGKLAYTKIQAGKPLLAYEELTALNEIMLLEGEAQYTQHHVLGPIKEAIEARDKRAKHIEHMLHVDDRRAERLRKEIDHITTGSLVARLHAAEEVAANPSVNERVYEAEEHKQSIDEAIQHEKSLNKRHKDKSLEEKLREEKDHIDRFIRHERLDEARRRAAITHEHAEAARGHRVSAAESDLLKNHLEHELHPLEEAMSTLGGNSRRVGHGGKYGQITSEIKNITTDKGSTEEALSTLVGASIPTAKMTLESIREAMQDSEVPKLSSEGASAETNAGLTQLLEEENRILATNYAVSQAQFAVLSNFQANLPHFDKGGPILQDGPIYAHRGEHVVPREGTLIMQGASSGTNLHHTTVVAGDMAALIKVIDSRITHPPNIQLISRQMATRKDLIPTRRRTV